MAVNGLAGFHGSAVHPTRVLRNLAATLLGQPSISHANSGTATTRGGCYGVALGGDLAVTATTGLGISIAAGRLAGPGTTALAQGAYVGYNDAAVVTAVGARNATNPRIDYVAWRVRDTDEDATGSEDDGLTVIAGTAAASPVVPTLSAGQGTLVILAEILVPSTANGGPIQITDRRTFLTAIGGIQRCTSSTRPTGAALFEGLYIDEANTDRLWRYSGAAWQPVKGRFGCAMVAVQAMATGFTNANWTAEAEDSDAYSSTGTQNITIPSGLGGKYIVAVVLMKNSAATVLSDVAVYINGSRAVTMTFGVGTSYANLSRPLTCAAGDVITVQIGNASASDTFTITAEVIRVSD